MAVDTKELFDTKIPSAMTANPDAAKEIASKYQINVTGVGEWFIDCSETGPKCEAGNPGGAECSITIAEEDFQSLIVNPSAGMQLYMSGKLKVEGNPMLAMKLSKLFKLGE
jgi:putative sterol carrier protein